MYIRIAEALRLAEQLQKDATKAVQELEVAKRHIDYRLDEWLRAYERDYEQMVQRKVDNAKYEGFDEGYEAGLEEGERKARIKIIQEQEKEKREKEEMLRQNSTTVLSKKLIDVGQPRVVGINTTYVDKPINYSYPHRKVTFLFIDQNHAHSAKPIVSPKDSTKIYGEPVGVIHNRPERSSSIDGVTRHPTTKVSTPTEVPHNAQTRIKSSDKGSHHAPTQASSTPIKTSSINKQKPSSTQKPASTLSAVANDQVNHSVNSLFGMRGYGAKRM